MLSPEYYEGCADDILGLYEQLENDIISDVIRRIMKSGKVTATARHRIEQIQESGILYDDILNTIASQTDATTQHIRALFEDAGVETVRFDNRIYRENGLTPVDIRQSPAMRQTLEAGYRKTLGDMKNLTMTTANTSQTAYINACNQAYMQITSGAFSYQEAIRQAVQKTAQDGVKVLYPSGHTERIDVAVRRAVLTGVGQTCREIGMMNAEECGCDLMEITAHSGARPAHAQWQGKIVSLSGKKGYLSKSDIGYGTGDGFGGWNCRHDWFPFFEGYSKRNYSEKDLQKLDEKNIEYNGKLYNQYEISQIQRRYEREIRAAKREQVAFKVAVEEADDPELMQVMQDSLNYANSLVRDRQNKMGDFIKQIFQSKKAKNILNLIDKSDEHDIMNIIRFERLEGSLPEQYVSALKTKYSYGTDIAKKIYDKFVPFGGAVADVNSLKAYHSCDTHKVYLNVNKDVINPRGAGTTWFHEHGHYIDYENNYISKSQEFLKCLKNDVKEYEQSYKIKHNLSNMKEVRNGITDEFNQNHHLSHSIQDIFGGVHKKRYHAGLYGHKTIYWIKSGKYGVCKEAFAHMFEALFDSDKQILMKHYLPTAWKEFQKILGGIV